jgi:2-dehydropantoate 2-reductase
MKIAILGAGSVGTFVGGSLIAAGADVTLIGRAAMQAKIATHGITLTDLQQRSQLVKPEQVRYTLDPAALSEADLILVTVKSGATASAAKDIARHARPGALVISLQNGIGNADVLRRETSAQQVLGGMVPYNVLQMAQGRLHRGTFGELTIEADPALARWQAVFASAHLPLQLDANFHALQWGKLLLNLNNPLNALSGLPLSAELSQRAYRQCLALLMQEAMAVLKVAGIRPAKVAAVPAALLPLVLRLPDPLFRLVAGSMLKIDPEARSSMWDDLQAGRATEIDHINGAVLTLAAKHGMRAPANAKIVELIHQAENGSIVSHGGTSLYHACREALL